MWVESDIGPGGNDGTSGGTVCMCGLEYLQWWPNSLQPKPNCPMELKLIIESIFVAIVGDESLQLLIFIIQLNDLLVDLQQ